MDGNGSSQSRSQGDQDSFWNRILIIIIFVIIGVILLIAIIFAANSSQQSINKVPEQKTLVFKGRLEGIQEVPSVITSGSGQSTVILSKDGKLITFSINVRDLTGPIVSAHFHVGGKGINGPIVKTITNDFIGDADCDEAIANGLWRSTDSEPLTPDLIQKLIKGELYINIHTSQYLAGEVRSQLFLTN